MEELNNELLSAAKEGKIEAVQRAIKNGADVNAKITEGVLKGYTALMFASHKGRMDIVKLLIKNNADINVTTESGDSALFMAITEEQAEVAQFLLQKGADPHLRYIHGETPLMVAVNAEEAMPEVIQLLLECGVETEIKDNTGKTALDYAKAMGNTSIIQLLEKSPK